MISAMKLCGRRDGLFIQHRMHPVCLTYFFILAPGGYVFHLQGVSKKAAGADFLNWGPRLFY